MIKKGRNIMIDIHMHTIYSDGDKTVEEVLKMCEAKYIVPTDIAMVYGLIGK